MYASQKNGMWVYDVCESDDKYVLGYNDNEHNKHVGRIEYL